MFYNEQHQAVKQITVKRIILERCKKKAMADVLNYYPPLKTSLRGAIDKADGKVEWKVEESSLDTRRSPGDSAVQLFSGMVFCGECGASMVRKTVPSGKKKYVYYVCSAHKQDKSCSPHRMRDEALEQLVLDTVKQYIRDVVDLDDILAMTDTAPLRTAEAQKVQRQLDKKHSEHERLQKLLMSLYENLADGIIDRDEYARLKQNYAGRCAECEKQMETLQETITQIKEHGGEHREWMAQFREHLNITELGRSIVVALIDRILIYRDNRVEVRFRFADEFAWQTIFSEDHKYGRWYKWQERNERQTRSFRRWKLPHRRRSNTALPPMSAFPWRTAANPARIP